MYLRFARTYLPDLGSIQHCEQSFQVAYSFRKSVFPISGAAFVPLTISWPTCDSSWSNNISFLAILDIQPEQYAHFDLDRILQSKLSLLHQCFSLLKSTILISLLMTTASLTDGHFTCIISSTRFLLTY